MPAQVKPAGTEHGDLGPDEVMEEGSPILSVSLSNLPKGQKRKVRREDKDQKHSWALVFPTNKTWFKICSLINLYSDYPFEY